MNSITIDAHVLIFFIVILLPIFICLFLTGYFLGKIGRNTGVYHDNTKPVGFFNTVNTAKPNKAITINDAKFVVDIKTDGLEKKYDNLGEVKNSDENIQSSVNKLKNMKA